MARLVAEAYHAAGDSARAAAAASACAAVARRHGLAVELASARLLRADALLGLGRPAAARRLLNRALPIVLGHGALEEKGKAHIVHGKCHLAAAAAAAPPVAEADAHKVPDDHKALQAAVGAFEKALEAFDKLGARALQRRGLYLLGRTLDAVGDVATRDGVAERFAVL